MKIRRGDAGSAVSIVQLALNKETAFTPKLAVDGLFGPKTEERVKQHQKQQKLLPDGIVGPLTLDTLFGIMRLHARAKFTRDGSKSAATSSPPAPVPLPPLNGSPSSWLNPTLAEQLRQQEAFWKWWRGQRPQPQLNPNMVVIPTNYGPMFLPRAPQRIELPAQPAKAHLKTDTDGGDFTLAFKGEAGVDVANGKFKEAKYGIGFDWAVFKSRLAEIEIGATVARDNKGDMTGELEVTLTGGSGLTLKHKIGQIGYVKLLPYLSTAVSSEASFEAAGGAKAYADLNLGKAGPFSFKASVGVKAGPKAQFGPVEGPGGREEHKWKVYPFVGTGFLELGVEF